MLGLYPLCGPLSLFDSWASNLHLNKELFPLRDQRWISQWVSFRLLFRVRSQLAKWQAFKTSRQIHWSLFKLTADEINMCSIWVRAQANAFWTSTLFIAAFFSFFKHLKKHAVLPKPLQRPHLRHLVWWSTKFTRHLPKSFKTTQEGKDNNARVMVTFNLCTSVFLF